MSENLPNYLAEVGQRVREKVEGAECSRQVADAVVDALTESGVDLQTVSLEDAKHLFAEALREARGLQPLGSAPRG